ncbi:recombinase family protein [Actinophytocola sp.]|uniref:recombinase family protein n=1 Tax=Actinophytocola sp. TaxID=1872138 RepID=UPI003D6B1965
MASETGRADDAGYPDPRRQPGHHIERADRPLFGYLRVGPLMPATEIEQLRRALANYARREGFTLLRTFVDDSPIHTAALAELTDALRSGQAAHVLVPSLRHLAHFPGVQLAMKDLLESQTGVRVLVMYPSLEESP